MNFDVKTAENKVVVINTPIRLDASNSQFLKDKLNEAMNNSSYEIVIDLSDTNFIDSSGLGALVSKINTCRNNNGDVRLSAPNGRVIEILQITHLDKVLKSYKTLQEAISSFDK